MRGIASITKTDGLRMRTRDISGQMRIAVHLGRAEGSELLLDELLPAFGMPIDTSSFSTYRATGSRTSVRRHASPEVAYAPRP
jgi:hypothetical protein